MDAIRQAIPSAQSAMAQGNEILDFLPLGEDDQCHEIEPFFSGSLHEIPYHVLCLPGIGEDLGAIEFHDGIVFGLKAFSL